MRISKLSKLEIFIIIRFYQRISFFRIAGVPLDPRQTKTQTVKIRALPVAGLKEGRKLPCLGGRKLPSMKFASCSMRAWEKTIFCLFFPVLTSFFPFLFLFRPQQPAINLGNAHSQRSTSHLVWSRAGTRCLSTRTQSRWISICFGNFITSFGQYVWRCKQQMNDLFKGSERLLTSSS